jgi:hypothetical protein
VKATDLLALALAEPIDSPAKALLVTAAVSAAVGAEYVLVGGSAVNVHTGVYRPTDLDLIGPLGPAVDRAMGSLGFARRGRYLVLESEGQEIVLDLPDDHLFDLAADPPERVEVATGVTAAVLSATDLMMDRILQATDGTAVTLEEALTLAVGAYKRIDWPDLERRAQAESSRGPRACALLPATLRKIRSVARTALRATEGASGPGGSPPPPR